METTVLNLLDFTYGICYNGGKVNMEKHYEHQKNNTQ